ncbi:hypothetical protein BP5796_07775 [Coleophoma crateriformis]|uniref:Uncharacterized protein n=1 Tax=Coleophoma crateriformis TaxID=565419 RepID=A0A3D8RCX3_9HELO|nr:hypothetical protein BP5796_07775 [Coleophoma crateriformis]
MTGVVRLMEAGSCIRAHYGLREKLASPQCILLYPSIEQLSIFPEPARNKATPLQTPNVHPKKPPASSEHHQLTMYSQLIFIAGVLLAFTSSHPTRAVARGHSFGPYMVSNYTPGYSFNVTYAPRNSTRKDAEPAFSTYCTGTAAQDGLQACANPVISASEQSSENITTLVIQHAWRENGVHFMVESDHAIQGSEQSFTMTATNAWAVGR